MKQSKKKKLVPRNPLVVPSRFRISAGPMKAGKKRLHKKLRENNRKIIKDQVCFGE